MLIAEQLIGSIGQSGERRHTDEQAGATETFVRASELSSFTQAADSLGLGLIQVPLHGVCDHLASGELVAFPCADLTIGE
ncbi:hypothetical protein ACFPU0_06790 [Pseudomonas sp. GCM10022186]|uniref:hypothetical protein n=1 Tax=Pseudomonas sp. GCM10022186 TaxID=3252650 RepID=UPI0036181BCC